MDCFYETYDCKIDDKGRVKFPLSLVRHLGSFIQKKMVVKRSVFQKCLEIYPMEPWERLMSEINGLNRFVKKNADFIRMFTAGAKTIEIDNAERILVPKDLKVFACLEKEIVISGVGVFFELWDKDLYEKSIKINSEDFAHLSEEIMGDMKSGEESSKWGRR
ncbi:MAG: division/cell wall cluster transcriptional repressor MraZ [Bergeyella sp.]|nr:division/cell wall cluster transcriptional repressor MraZ [Bergeyella sp.]